MEEQYGKSIFDDFTVDDEGKSTLADISRWMNLNAIAGFVSLGISFVSVIISFIRLSEFGGSGIGGMMTGTILTLLITAAISLLLNITLLQAATNIKKAVETHDQFSFNRGVGKMASYFKIFGILLIIAIVIFVLAFLFAIAMSAGRGF